MTVTVERFVEGRRYRQDLLARQPEIRKDALRPNGWCAECDRRIEDRQGTARFCSDRCKRRFSRYTERGMK